MKSFTNTVETMDNKKKNKESNTLNGLGSSIGSGDMLRAESTNESATAASSLTGMSLSANSSISANFLSASQFKTVLLVTKTIAMIFLIWIVFKLLTGGSGSNSIPRIMMGGVKAPAGVQEPIEVSLDYGDFSEL
jgi:hypothetical protein